MQIPEIDTQSTALGGMLLLAGYLLNTLVRLVSRRSDSDDVVRDLHKDNVQQFRDVDNSIQRLTLEAHKTELRLVKIETEMIGIVSAIQRVGIALENLTGKIESLIHRGKVGDQ
jgi:hypothetical protein